MVYIYILTTDGLSVFNAIALHKYATNVVHTTTKTICIYITLGIVDQEIIAKFFMPKGNTKKRPKLNK